MARRVPVSYNPDFLLNVCMNLVPGFAPVFLAGHNADLDSGVEEDIWEAGGTLQYLSSAEKMNITSTSVNDAAAGTGLRTFDLFGILADGSIGQEIITMDGTSNVLTLNEYLFIEMFDSLNGTVGSGGVNAGDITATAETAGTIQCEMDAGEGRSQNSHYRVPAKKSLIILQLEFNAARISGGSAPEIEFRMLTRRSITSPYVQLFDKKLDTSVSDELDVFPPLADIIPSGGDIKIVAKSDTNNTEARTRFYGLLVDNNYIQGTP